MLLSTAQVVRLAHAISKPTSAHSSIPYPNPHNTTRKNTKINTATRTSATSEDRDSEIRQRCGCNIISSYAESCSAPISRRHVEDVHSHGVEGAAAYAMHETCTRNQQTNLRPLRHHIPQPKQHNTQRYKKSTWQHVQWPPAKIATPTFGNDVALREYRASLRAAVLQAPDVALKMSTAVEPLVPPAAQGMRLAHAIRKAASDHSSIPYPNPHNTTRKDTKKSIWQHVPPPPAKIAIPWFGSDVAARYPRASLRAAVLHFPDVTLKMSTAFERPEFTELRMRLAHAIRQAASDHSGIRFSNPHNTTRKDTKMNTLTRTKAASEDCDSEIRQRCGCKSFSSFAESCSAPHSRRHVEDVHSAEGDATPANCASRETCTRNQKSNLRPLKHPIPQPKQHNTQRYENDHGNTYRSHQRRSRFHDSAAMWLRDFLELR
jgi:hypothetical protein